MDPDSPDEECPAVFVDPDTGDAYYQGRTVTSPELLARIAEHSPIAADESVVWHPERMRPIVLEALTGAYDEDRRGPGTRTFGELLGNAKRSAVHLEMRDSYDTSHAGFQDWLSGGTGRYDRSSWTETARSAVERGVRMRRARVVSEPVTDYIRWEHLLTDENLKAGEEVRWLPRREAFDLMLPGADFWMFDQRIVRFNFNAGEGTSLGQYELVSDPRRVERIVAAFEMV